MVTTHNLGFPRIGEGRELKFAVEKYWAGELSEAALAQTGAALRARHWRAQIGLTSVPVGDFSWYDQVLDMSVTLGHLPSRVAQTGGAGIQRYFRAARGRAPGDSTGVQAAEMTKWFDTNYHYIVPEFSADTAFSLHAGRLLAQLAEAKTLNLAAKPVIIGPVTYLWLGKAKDDSDKLRLLDRLLPVYGQLLDALAEEGAEWVQIDEPILVCDLDPQWHVALRTAYQRLKASVPKLLLTTYFGPLEDNLSLACELPVQGLHLDAVNARHEVHRAIELLDNHKILSLGVIDGRNVWKTDLQRTLDWLQPLYDQLKSRLWLAPSCSLLHVPVNLDRETGLDSDIKSWLAFAVQKLEELQVLARALTEGAAAVASSLAANAEAIESRRHSTRVHNPAVQAAVAAIDDSLGRRRSSYTERAVNQAQHLRLPLLPTTTIGSFPQTADIRRTRLQYRRGELDRGAYIQRMQQEIQHAVREQEALDLDVLVHGEAERNDMVEYFGQQLQGFAFTQSAWVQSYGSRCVKPPILFGDVSRPAPMTVEWINYARSLTDKPVKGMLTGPVTILNWSFVRDDQPRADTAFQLALAIRDEVLDLEQAGVRIIQIDEAALREGLPLRRSQWNDYLNWAVQAFRLAANGVDDATQIHTHMCYSEFNDIIDAIAALDADVITIESSRSQMELLGAFDRFDYPNEIGPGVYDIHSPNIPGVDEMVRLLEQAAEKIPLRRLWVNPDCGLKTRNWEEVAPALRNMVAAAKRVREKMKQKVDSQQSTVDSQ